LRGVNYVVLNKACGVPVARAPGRGIGNDWSFLRGKITPKKRKSAGGRSRACRLATRARVVSGDVPVSAWSSDRAGDANSSNRLFCVRESGNGMGVRVVGVGEVGGR
jgi:hypothetical protein